MGHISRCKMENYEMYIQIGETIGENLDDLGHDNDFGHNTKGTIYERNK